ncbi:MAG: hypothetical protein AB1486_16765 [Planctomycetota bacterium]
MFARRISNFPRLLTLLRFLILLQVLLGLVMTGRHVLVRSEFRGLWTGAVGIKELGDRLRGKDYATVASFSHLPDDARILVVSPELPWFLNYYLLPRAAFRHPRITRAEHLRWIPHSLLSNHQITHVMLYDPPNVQLWPVETTR